MTKVHSGTFPTSSSDYTHLGMPVLCGTFLKNADRNRTKYVVNARSQRIKQTYGNGESDSLWGKICDMHTFGKYVNNAAIAYKKLSYCKETMRLLHNTEIRSYTKVI